eukprot:gene45704-61099_t
MRKSPAGRGFFLRARLRHAASPFAGPRDRRRTMPLATLIGRWAMKPFSKALPPLGDTERAALEAGTVGFEGRLFAGRPDFDVLAAMGPNQLTEREQAFLDNEVRALCHMLDDHAIDQARDLPPE